MEVIQINKLKENLITIITNEIKAMNEENFISFVRDIDLFKKDEILTFTDSFDSAKIKFTYLKGVNALINFLEYLDIKHKEKIREYLYNIKFLLLSED